MSVLHVLIFLFWKPFDFCPVIFFGPKLISSVFEKTGKQLISPLPPLGDGGGGGRALGQNLYRYWKVREKSTKNV